MKSTKLLYMSLAAALAATNLTSCIDNDEPDGIVALRQAKSEFIKAETAVKNAEAEKQTLENQLIEYQKQIQEINVKLKDLDYKKAAAQSELEIEQINNEKALLAKQLEAQQLQMETTLLNLKAANAEAQQAYTSALNAAKADAEVFDEQSGSYVTLRNVYGKLKSAQTVLYFEEQNYLASWQSYVRAVNTAAADSVTLEATLKNDLASAKFAQEKAEAIVEIGQSYYDQLKAAGALSEEDKAKAALEFEVKKTSIESEQRENNAAREAFRLTYEQKCSEFNAQITDLENQKIGYDKNGTEYSWWSVYSNSETDYDFQDESGNPFQYYQFYSAFDIVLYPNSDELQKLLDNFLDLNEENRAQVDTYKSKKAEYQKRKSAYDEAKYAGESEIIAEAKKALEKAEKAVREEYEVLLAANDAVQEASEAVQDAIDAIDDEISGVNLAKAILSSTDPELEAEATKLQYEWNLIDAAENALGDGDLSDIEEGLAQAKANVETAKANVAVAQLKLDQFYEGSYSAADDVKEAKLALDEAKKSRDEAKTAYDYYSELYKSTVAKLSAE